MPRTTTSGSPLKAILRYFLQADLKSAEVALEAAQIIVADKRQSAPARRPRAAQAEAAPAAAPASAPSGTKRKRGRPKGSTKRPAVADVAAPAPPTTTAFPVDPLPEQLPPGDDE